MRLDSEIAEEPSPDGDRMIRIEYVQVRFQRGTPVLSIDRLEIERGERVAVIGPSGAGKSTLLRSIKGYLRPAQGKLEVMGSNLLTVRPEERRAINRRIALIYQQFHLAPRLTVLQNVLCGRLGLTSRWRSLLGFFKPEDLRTAWAAICEVGLQNQVHQRADTLSGGEKQRVAVARAVAQQPSIILADEPVSSLDPAWAEDVLDLIGAVQQHHEATLVMSLHQPHLARRYASRIIGLRQGRVVLDDSPAALTDANLEELYRGDDLIPINSATAKARAS
ncbi:MAG: phosphonate ABC transporter ATP-binding protein [Verrucomicrobia bacterium]|nr:phosphonate ABC transporter ATP-binding protein [Verrucomicrobiota bacterium]